jgi:molybdenum cofactor synthesis domain-containing protein
MLQLQVENAIGVIPMKFRVVDNLDFIRQAILEAASNSDWVIVSGGASVGDRDFLEAALADLGTVHFHGVAIRPGKPTLLATVGNCFILGLPGNPASAFVCFELFAREALRKLSGWSDPEIRWVEAVSGFAHKACGREDFVRIRLSEGCLVEAGEQGSFGIRSLARAHGLARFPADHDTPAGERCMVAWLT